MSFALPKWLSKTFSDTPFNSGSAPLSLYIDSKSVQGTRSEDNQDAYLALGSDRLFAVADGMGGHAGGRIASRTALDTIYNRVVEANKNISKELLLDAIQHGNQRIRHNAVINPRLRGMGTTIAMIWLEQTNLHCFYVGDSRIYRWRDYRLEQLSKDHTGQIKKGRNKPALSRALGGGDSVDVDYQYHHWQRGDSILLCSDGVSDALADYRISNILAGQGGEGRIADRLIEQATQSGGSDDKTAVWIEDGLC